MARSQHRLLQVLGGAAVLLVVLGIGLGFRASYRWVQKVRAERAALKTKLHAGSDYDATKDIVDDDYKFRLAWPGAGSKLVREEDARELVPDAIAGAIHEAGCFGIVIVEEIPGSDVDGIADLLIENMPLDQKATLDKKRSVFQSHPANFFSVTGSLTGTRLRYDGAVVLKDSFVYQLLTWHVAHTAPGRPDCFSWFTSAFQFQPGKPVERRDDRPTPDQDGVGTRVKKRELVSAVDRLAVSEGDGLRLIVGEELADMDGTAFVGMQSGSVMYLLISSRPVPKGGERRAREVVDEKASLAGLTFAETEHALPLGDRKLSFVRFAQAGKPFEHLLAADNVHDRELLLWAWYPASLAARGQELLKRALRRMRFVPDAEAEALAKELLTQPDPESLVLEKQALRAGRFWDFERAFRLKKPPGFWRAHTGVFAEQAVEGSVLYLEEVRSGLNAALIVGDAGDVAVLQRDVFARLSGQDAPNVRLVSRDRPINLPGAVRSNADVFDGRTHHTYDLTTTKNGAQVLHLVAWGPKTEMTREQSSIDQLVSSLETFSQLPIVAYDGRTLKDQRLGFEFAPPGAGWTYKAIPSPVGATGAMFQNGGRTMVIVGMPGGRFKGPSWITNFLEQDLARRLNVDSVVAPERSDVNIAGVPARRVRWPGMRVTDGVILGRGSAQYVIVTQGPTGDTDVVELAKSLRFVD
jgi:hypothetical protein